MSVSDPDGRLRLTERLKTVSEYFEIRTLSFACGIITITLWGCMLFVALTRKVYPGFKTWTIATLLNSIGMISLSLRNILPDFVTIVIANLLLTFFFVLIARGLIEFADGKQKLWLDIVPVAVISAAFLYFTYYSPNVSARVIAISLVIAALCGRNILIICKQIPLILFSTNWFLLMSLILMGGWFLLRTLFTLIFENQIVDFMSASAFQGLSFYISFVGNITLVIGLITMNAQRLEQDLIKAMDQVKTLTGLIPICSSCKKIRDDQGYWQEVEIYVRNHSEADFSHGLCPECLKRLYPKYAMRINKKNGTVST